MFTKNKIEKLPGYVPTELTALAKEKRMPDSFHIAASGGQNSGKTDSPTLGALGDAPVGRYVSVAKLLKNTRKTYER